MVSGSTQRTRRRRARSSGGGFPEPGHGWPPPSDGTATSSDPRVEAAMAAVPPRGVRAGSTSSGLRSTSGRSRSGRSDDLPAVMVAIMTQALELSSDDTGARDRHRLRLQHRGVATARSTTSSASSGSSPRRLRSGASSARLGVTASRSTAATAPSAGPRARRTTRSWSPPARPGCPMPWSTNSPSAADWSSRSAGGVGSG